MVMVMVMVKWRQLESHRIGDFIQQRCRHAFVSALDAPNVMLKKQVMDLLSALCVSSEQGFNVCMHAVNKLKVIRLLFFIFFSQFFSFVAFIVILSSSSSLCDVVLNGNQARVAFDRK